MIELLLYTSLNCTDTVAMLNRIRRNENMEEYIKEELIEVIQESTPHCPWDAHD
jgi:hypothetical protein